MSVFEHPDFDQHEKVSFFNDSETGLQAIIAVHNTNLGASLGGCRMFPYTSSAQALTDVLRLSSGMSYKAAMAGLPQGGGKAVMLGNPRAMKSEAIMQAMGRFVDSMDGSYIIAEDSGISVSDVKQMGSQTPYISGTHARYSFNGEPADGNPAPATAFGVFCGIKAAVEHTYGSDLNGKTIAIQGIGQVGLRLAQHLYTAGANLLVSDIHPDNLLVAQREFDAKIVSNDTIHNAKADVFAPCALGGAINRQSIGELRAKIVAGAANNQLSEASMANVLREKGIAYVPDYVINAGGIIDIYHQTQSDSSDAKLNAQLQNIGSTITQLLEISAKDGRSTLEIANHMVEQRLYRVE